MMNDTKSQKGFTLLELIIAMAIGFLIVATSLAFISDSASMVKSGGEVLDAQRLGIGAMDYIEGKMRLGKSLVPGTNGLDFKSSVAEGLIIEEIDSGNNMSMLGSGYFSPYIVDVHFKQPVAQVGTHDLIEVTLILKNTNGETVYKLKRTIELINSLEKTLATPEGSVVSNQIIYY